MQSCVTFPATTPPDALAARFVGMIDRIRHVVWNRGVCLPARVILMRLMSRLARLGQRVAAISAQIEAGSWTPPKRRASRAGSRKIEEERPPEHPPDAITDAVPAAPPVPVAPPRKTLRVAEPRQRGWLIAMLDTREIRTLSQCGSMLYQMLTEPGMHALLAAAPSLSRQIRPLCRMLGVKPHPHFPPELFPPRPPRKRKPKPKPEPGPEPEPFVYYSAAPPIVASKYGPPDWRDTTRTHTRTMRLGSFIIERERPPKLRKNSA